MKLYIGGVSQGKSEYVIKSEKHDFIIDEKNYVNYINSDLNNKKIILNHFNLIVRDLIFKNMGETEITNLLDNIFINNPNIIIISDEIGNGIVPMDKRERLYRDITGHLLIGIADKSESVIRIICGIPMVIK